MNFRIFLRCSSTGLESGFDDKQAVADFLAGVDREDYTGWQSLGELPAPTVVSAPEPEIDPAAPNEEFPGEPVVTSAPEGVFVEGAGVVSTENLQAAGIEVTEVHGDTYLPVADAPAAPDEAQQRSDERANPPT